MADIGEGHEEPGPFPLPLFWVKKKKNRRRKKNRQGKRQKKPPHSFLIARPMPTFYVSHSRNTGNFNLWRSAFYAILWMNTDYSTLTGFYSDDFAWNKTWDQMKQSRSSGNIRLRFLLLQLLWCFLGHPSTVISIICWKMSGWARKINVNYQNLRYMIKGVELTLEFE